MKNQNMPANPLPNGADNRPYFIPNDEGLRSGHLYGETKREKAFWQVYSAMIANPSFRPSPCSCYSSEAIKAVNAGFKALDQGE